jgi:pimeloyl-ACP methyl ester carboxylesterase
MSQRKYPVLLIHGFTSNKIANLPLHQALRREGFQTYNVDIPGLNTQDIRKSSPLVAAKVLEIKEKNNCDQVQLIGISIGGLIGLHYLRKHDGHLHINKFVALGTPFKGTPVGKVLDRLPLEFRNALKQLIPNNEHITEITEGNFESVDITSIGAEGDTFVPEPLFYLENAKNVLSPHGTWPIGHYDLVLKKANHELLILELDSSNPLL